MRKIVTLFAFLFSASIFAQGLIIVSAPDTVYCDPNAAADVEAKIIVKNEGSDSAYYKAKRNGTYVNICSSNYFCWDLCYLPTDDVSTGGLGIKSGEVNNWFSGHIITPGDGMENNCTIRYTFFNVADPDDTLSHEVTFMATNAFSVEEQTGVINSVFPNPASDYINVDVREVKEGTRFSILNVVGQEVKSVDVDQNQGFFTVDVSDLNPGIYFYSLNVNGKSVESKRLVISK